jgi:hypothetical protein
MPADEPADMLGAVELVEKPTEPVVDASPAAQKKASK